MGMADIPRFSQIHRGKGYLIVTRGKWGYEEWYKIYWNNGIKRDFIYEKSYYSCENYEYAVPKEPLLQTTEYYGYLTDLVMTQVFGIWDED